METNVLDIRFFEKVERGGYVALLSFCTIFGTIEQSAGNK